MVLGETGLVWGSKGLLCLYILKKSGYLVGCHHSWPNKQPKEQVKIELLSHGSWKAEMSN